jgi:long-chain acyl-CoA synthetase
MVALSFLPLAHVFERASDFLYFKKAMTIAYAESIDKFGENFLEVKPHFFAAVPRVYEKVLARIQAAVENAPPIRQKIFAWSVATGKQRVNLMERGKPVSGLLNFKYKIADKLVFAKIRARLGGRFQFAISGGAPLARDVAEFFWGAGIKIFEGFGLTETSPVLTTNTPDAWRLGTVGKAIPGVSIKIAEDGEILARGPNIMKGYWGKKDETDRVFTQDGWFLTGDIGAFDSDGFLTITDRKKELLVTAYGKNVAPAPIEGALKTIRYVGTAVLIGDRKKFLSALISPNFEALEGWARSHGIEYKAKEDLIRDPKVRALYQQALDIVNGDEPSERRIKAFTLLPNELTIDGGELTPTLKLKRRVISQKYAQEIDSMYAGIEEKGDAFSIDSV